MMEKEFDVTKIIKRTRDLKVFAKSKLITEKIKVELEHSRKKVIYIDTTEPEESDTNIQIEISKTATKSKILSIAEVRNMFELG